VCDCCAETTTLEPPLDKHFFVSFRMIAQHTCNLSRRLRSLPAEVLAPECAGGAGHEHSAGEPGFPVLTCASIFRFSINFTANATLALAPQLSQAALQTHFKPEAVEWKPGAAACL